MFDSYLHKVEDSYFAPADNKQRVNETPVCCPPARFFRSINWSAIAGYPASSVRPVHEEGEPLALTPAQALLRKLVLDAVPSPHTRRNYAKALDDLFAFCASRLSPGPY
jgi:hypothetical protein